MSRSAFRCDQEGRRARACLSPTALFVIFCTICAAPRAQGLSRLRRAARYFSLTHVCLNHNARCLSREILHEIPRQAQYAPPAALNLALTGLAGGLSRVLSRERFLLTRHAGMCIKGVCRYGGAAGWDRTTFECGETHYRLLAVHVPTTPPKPLPGFVLWHSLAQDAALMLHPASMTRKLAPTAGWLKPHWIARQPYHHGPKRPPDAGVDAATSALD